MTFDKNMFKAEIIRSGFKMGELAEWFNVKPQAVTSKILGKTKWSREDIVIVAEHIGRDKILDIFFAE